MKITPLLALLCALGLAIDAPGETPADFYKRRLPANTELGMSLESFTAAHPQARRLDPGAAEGKAEMMEMIRDGQTMTVTSYRFRAGKLEGVLYSAKTSLLPVTESRVRAQEWLAELKAIFTLKGEEEILRTNKGSVVVLTAQRWADAHETANLYFVATSDELTLTVFNPKVLNKSDFFLGPEKRQGLEDNVKAAPTPAGSAPKPAAPLVDFLKKTDPAGE